MSNVYEVNQIDAASWAITDDNVRILLFAGTDKALMVDSGYGNGDLKATVAQLTNLPIMLVNSHADFDHIGANAQFDKAYMHPSEFARYRAEVARFNLSDGKELAVSPLWEGDIIDLGNRKFEVILIPGHTPGSIALLDEKNRILLGGDSVLDDIIAMVNDWRNFDAYINSMQKLNNMRDRFDIIYTPHGTFPLSADILEGLIDSAKRCQRGEVEGVETDFIKFEECKLYDTGVAKFLF